MKKTLILCLIIFLLAFTFKPGIDITGLFLKATSTIVTIAKTVVKEFLSFVIRVL